MRNVAIWGLAASLVGCFSDDAETLPYPRLDREQLLGCWSQDQTYGGHCSVRCYDRSGLYFAMSTFENPLPEVAERLGTFIVSGNDVYIEEEMKTTQGKWSKDQMTWHWTILDGQLWAVEGNQVIGGSSYSRVDPDSLPCGLNPWTLFQKPASWTLF